MLERYRRTWRLLPRSARLYLAAEAVAAVAAGAMSSVFNLYIRALGYEAGFLADLLTLTSVGAGFGALLAGRLVDRAGPRRVLLGSSLVTAAGIATQLTARSVDPASLMLGAGIVTGLGASAYFVAAAPFLARAAGDAPRDDVFSLDTAIVLACGAFGTAVAGQSATLLIGSIAAVDAYRITLLAGAAVGALSFPLLVFADGPELVAAEALRQPAQRAASLSVLWQEPAIGRLIVIAVLIAAGAGLFAPYVNVFFVEELGASPALYGWLTAAATLTRLGATLLAPSLARRAGTVPAIALTQLASVPLLLLLGFGPTLAVAAGAYLTRGALMNMAAPLHVSFRMAVVPAALHGTASSAIWVADQVTRAASTWIGGRLIESVGYRVPYMATAVCYVAASLLYLLWFGRRATPR